MSANNVLYALNAESVKKFRGGIEVYETFERITAYFIVIQSVSEEAKEYQKVLAIGRHGSKWVRFVIF
jgi:hypothetical protein